MNDGKTPTCDACGQERPPDGQEDTLTYEVGNARAVWHARLCGKPSCLAIAAANIHMGLTTVLQGSSMIAPTIIR